MKSSDPYRSVCIAHKENAVEFRTGNLQGRKELPTLPSETHIYRSTFRRTFRYSYLISADQLSEAEGTDGLCLWTTARVALWCPGLQAYKANTWKQIQDNIPDLRVRVPLPAQVYQGSALPPVRATERLSWLLNSHTQAPLCLFVKNLHLKIRFCFLFSFRTAKSLLSYQNIFYNLDECVLSSWLLFFLFCSCYLQEERVLPYKWEWRLLFKGRIFLLIIWAPFILKKNSWTCWKHRICKLFYSTGVSTFTVTTLLKKHQKLTQKINQVRWGRKKMAAGFAAFSN